VLIAGGLTGTNALSSNPAPNRHTANQNQPIFVPGLPFERTDGPSLVRFTPRK